MSLWDSWGPPTSTDSSSYVPPTPTDDGSGSGGSVADLNGDSGSSFDYGAPTFAGANVPQSDVSAYTPDVQVSDLAPGTATGSSVVLPPSVRNTQGGGSLASHLSMAAAATHGGGDSDVSMNAELSRRMGIIDLHLPGLGAAAGDSVLKIIQSSSSDAQLLDAAQALAEKTAGRSFVHQFRALSAQLQRQQWSQMAPSQKAVLRQYGYELPAKPDSTSFRIPGTDWHIGGADEIASNPLDVIGNSVGAALRATQHGIAEGGGTAMRWVGMAAGGAEQNYRAMKFDELQGGLARQAGETAFSAHLRQAGYATIDGHVVPGSTPDSDAIETPDGAKRLGVPDAVIAAAEGARKRAEDENHAVQDVVLGKDNDWASSFLHASDGEMMLKPGTQLSMYRSVGSDYYAFSIAKHMAARPNDRGWLSELALRAGPYGSPAYEAQLTRINQIVSAPGFDRAVNQGKNGHISFGRTVASDTFKLHPGGGTFSPYSLVSGAVDAYTLVNADPTLVLGKTFGAFRAARWAIDTEEAMQASHGAYLLAKHGDDAYKLATSSPTMKAALDALERQRSVRGIPAMLRDVGAKSRTIQRGRAVDEIAKAWTSPTKGAWADLERRMPSAARVARGLGDYERGLVSSDGHGIRDSEDIWQFFQGGNGLTAMGAGLTNPMWAKTGLYLPTYSRTGARELIRSGWTKAIDFSAEEGKGLTQRAQVALRGVEDVPAVEGRLARAQLHAESIAGRIVSTPGQLGRGLTLQVPRSLVLDRTEEGTDNTRKAIYSWMAMAGASRSQADEVVDRLIRGSADLRQAAVAAGEDGRGELWHQVSSVPDGSYRNVVQGYLKDLFTNAQADTRIADTAASDTAERYVNKLFRNDHVYGPNGWDEHAGTPSAIFPVAQSSTRFALPQLRDFGALLRRQSFTRRMLGFANNEVFDAAMRRYWKPTMLLRAGFVPRAAAEELLSFVARTSPRVLAETYGAQYAARGPYAGELTEATDKARRVAFSETLDRAHELGQLPVGETVAHPGELSDELYAHFDKRYQWHLNDIMPTAKTDLARDWDTTELVALRPLRWALERGESALADSTVSDGFRNRMSVKFGSMAAHAKSTAFESSQYLRRGVGHLVDARYLEAANEMLRDPILQRALIERVGGSSINVAARSELDPTSPDAVWFRDGDTGRYVQTVPASDRHLPKGEMNRAVMDPAEASDAVGSNASMMWAEPSLGADRPGGAWEVVGGHLRPWQADEGWRRLAGTDWVPPGDLPAGYGPLPPGPVVDPFAGNAAASEAARHAMVMGDVMDAPLTTAEPAVEGAATPAGQEALGTANDAQAAAGITDEPNTADIATPPGAPADQLAPGIDTGPSAAAADVGQVSSPDAPDTPVSPTEVPEPAPVDGTTTPPEQAQVALGRDHLVTRVEDLKSQLRDNRDAMATASPDTVDAMRRRQQELTKRLEDSEAALRATRAEAPATAVAATPTPVAGDDLEALRREVGFLEETIPGLSGGERRKAEARYAEAVAQLRAADPTVEAQATEGAAKNAAAPYAGTKSKSGEARSASDQEPSWAWQDRTDSAAPAPYEPTDPTMGPLPITPGATRNESDAAINERISRLRSEREAAVRNGVSGDDLAKFDDRIAAATRERATAEPITARGEGDLIADGSAGEAAPAPGTWEDEYANNRKERRRLGTERPKGWTKQAKELDRRAHELEVAKRGGRIVPNPLLDTGPVDESILHGRTPNPVADIPGDPLLDERTNQAYIAYRTMDGELNVNAKRIEDAVKAVDTNEVLAAQRERYQLMSARTEAWKRFRGQAERMARERAPEGTEMISALAPHVSDNPYTAAVADLVEAKGLLSTNRINREHAYLRGLDDAVARYDAKAEELGRRVDDARVRMAELHGAEANQVPRYYTTAAKTEDDRVAGLIDQSGGPPESTPGAPSLSGSANDPHYQAKLAEQAAEEARLRGEPVPVEEPPADKIAPYVPGENPDPVIPDYTPAPDAGVIPTTGAEMPQSEVDSRFAAITDPTTQGPPEPGPALAPDGLPQAPTPPTVGETAPINPVAPVVETARPGQRTSEEVRQSLADRSARIRENEARVARGEVMLPLEDDLPAKPTEAPPSIDRRTYEEARQKVLDNRAARKGARGKEAARLDTEYDELKANLDIAGESIDIFDFGASKDLKGAGAPPISPGGPRYGGNQWEWRGDPGEHPYVQAVNDFRTWLASRPADERQLMRSFVEMNGFQGLAHPDEDNAFVRLAHQRQTTRARVSDLTDDERRAMQRITGKGQPMQITRNRLLYKQATDPEFAKGMEFVSRLDGGMSRQAIGDAPLKIRVRDDELQADLTKAIHGEVLRPSVGGRLAGSERLNMLSDGTPVVSAPGNDQIPVYGVMHSSAAADDLARRAEVAKRPDGTYDIDGLAANLGYRDDAKVKRYLQGLDLDAMQRWRAARALDGTQSTVDVASGWVSTSYDDALEMNNRLAARLDGGGQDSVPGLFFADTRGQGDWTKDGYQGWFRNPDPHSGFHSPPGWYDQFDSPAAESILDAKQRSGITPLGLDGEEVTRMNEKGMISANGQLAAQGGDYLRAVDELAAVQAKTMAWNLSNSRGEVMHDIVAPLRAHGSILPDDIGRLNFNDLPDKITARAKAYTAEPGRLAPKLVRWGFDKAIGPAITSIARRPMFMAAYADGIDQGHLVAKMLTSDAVEGDTDTLLKNLNGSEDVPSLEATLGTLRNERRQVLIDMNHADDAGDEAQRIAKRDHASDLTHRLTGVEKRLNDARDRGDITRDHLTGWWNSLEPEDQRSWKDLSFDQKRKRLLDVGAPDSSALNVDLMNGIERYGNYQSNLDDLRRSIATNHALNQVIPYIDDHAVRSVFADDARNVIPFLFAEEQFLKRWARTLVTDPSTLRKAQLLMNGMSATGMVQTDPGTGAKMFMYPGSSELMSLFNATGIGKLIFGGAVTQPVVQPLSGDLRFMLPGLAQPGQVSMGPMVSMPLNAAASMFPELRHSRDEILGRAANQPVTSQLFPTWARNIWRGARGDDSDKQITAATIDQVKLQHVKSDGLRHQAAIAERRGDHKHAADLDRQADELAPPDDADAITRKRFVDNVRGNVRAQYVLRGVLGFFSPGQAVGVGGPNKLESEYTDLLDTMAPDEALNEYMSKHPDATAYTVFKTTSPSMAYIPPTKEAMDFMRAHPDLPGRYPLGGAWLLPQAKATDSNADAYHEELSAGLRQYRSADEWEKQYHYARVARPYFNDKLKKDQALAQATKDGDTQLAAQIKLSWRSRSQWYKNSFPLFNEMLTSPTRRTQRAQVLSELRVALVDPSVPTTPQSADLAQVIAAYDTYNSALAQIGTATTDAATTARQQLKADFARWGQRHVESNSRVRAFWDTIIAPSAGVSYTDTADDGTS